MPHYGRAADRTCMATLRRLLVVLAACAVVLAAAGLAHAGTPRTSAVWRFCGGCAASGGDLGRYGYVGLNADQASRVPAIHTGGGKALVYKDMSSTRSWSCGGPISGGLDYCAVDRDHPAWFTTDQNGARLQWDGYPGVWQMDVGDPGYQDAWADAVIADARANGWDGVVIDNANVDTEAYLHGRTLREYPTAASYQAATRSFLARVCPRVIAAGLLCLPNIQANPAKADAALWADWTQFTSGGVREYWMKWGGDTTGAFGDGGWDDLQAVAETVQRAGKIFLPVTYAPLSDVRSIRWGRANFLLTWDGGPSAFVFAPTPEAQDPWSPEWTAEIGTPTGPRALVGGVWRREFTGGTVLVNRTSAPVEVDLGAAYALADGTSGTHVRLDGLSGLVLARAAAIAPPPAKKTDAPATNDGFRINVDADVVPPAKPAATPAEPPTPQPAPTVEVSGRVSPATGITTKIATALRDGTATVYGSSGSGWKRLGAVRIDAKGRFVLRRTARIDGVRVVARVGERLVRSRTVRVG
jgi:Hypothetical glycosyl hydrolase family 15